MWKCIFASNIELHKKDVLLWRNRFVRWSWQWTAKVCLDWTFRNVCTNSDLLLDVFCYLSYSISRWIRVVLCCGMCRDGLMCVLSKSTCGIVKTTRDECFMIYWRVQYTMCALGFWNLLCRRFWTFFIYVKYETSLRTACDWLSTLKQMLATIIYCEWYKMSIYITKSTSTHMQQYGNWCKPLILLVWPKMNPSHISMVSFPQMNINRQIHANYLRCK